MVDSFGNVAIKDTIENHEHIICRCSFLNWGVNCILDDATLTLLGSLTCVQATVAPVWIHPCYLRGLWIEFTVVTNLCVICKSVCVIYNDIQ